MRLHAIRSIEIEGTYEDAFRYIANPSNLPSWAEAFASVDAGSAVLRTPQGEANIALRVDASEQAGTIDWTMTFATGAQAVAHSRLTPGAAGRLVYTFVLNAPPLPLEELEGALAAQAITLESELVRLKARLENGHGS
jgi:hypothetical protein